MQLINDPRRIVASTSGNHKNLTFYKTSTIPRVERSGGNQLIFCHRTFVVRPYRKNARHVTNGGNPTVAIIIRIYKNATPTAQQMALLTGQGNKLLPNRRWRFFVLDPLSSTET